MSVVTSCECGNSFRIPADQLGQSIQCPACGRQLTAAQPNKSPKPNAGMQTITASKFGQTLAPGMLDQGSESERTGEPVQPSTPSPSSIRPEAQEPSAEVDASKTMVGAPPSELTEQKESQEDIQSGGQAKIEDFLESASPPELDEGHATSPELPLADSPNQEAPAAPVPPGSRTLTNDSGMTLAADYNSPEIQAAINSSIDPVSAPNPPENRTSRSAPTHEPPPEPRFNVGSQATATEESGEKQSSGKSWLQTRVVKRVRHAAATESWVTTSLALCIIAGLTIWGWQIDSLMRLFINGRLVEMPWLLLDLSGLIPWLPSMAIVAGACGALLNKSWGTLTSILSAGVLLVSLIIPTFGGVVCFFLLLADSGTDSFQPIQFAVGRMLTLMLQSCFLLPGPIMLLLSALFASQRKDSGTIWQRLAKLTNGPVEA